MTPVLKIAVDTTRVSLSAGQTADLVPFSARIESTVVDAEGAYIFLQFPQHQLCAVRLPPANCHSTVSVVDEFDPVVYGSKPWALQASPQDNIVKTVHGYAHSTGRYFRLLSGLVSASGFDIRDLQRRTSLPARNNTISIGFCTVSGRYTRSPSMNW